MIFKRWRNVLFSQQMQFKCHIQAFVLLRRVVGWPCSVCILYPCFRTNMITSKLHGFMLFHSTTNMVQYKIMGVKLLKLLQCSDMTWHSLWHMKNAAGDCQGHKHSHQQESIQNIQVRGGVWVERARGRNHVFVHSTSTPASALITKSSRTSLSLQLDIFVCVSKVPSPLFHPEMFVFSFFLFYVLLCPGSLKSNFSWGLAR